jgi:hypothetical protein
MSGEVHPLRLFDIRAQARALLLKGGMFADSEEAFRPLWIDAEQDGLFPEFGTVLFERLIAQACTDAGLLDVEFIP